MPIPAKLWQLMDLSSTGIAETATYLVTFAASCDFWHDFAGKGLLNVLGGVLPKSHLLF